MPRECETASLSTSLRGALATKQSIPPFARLDGLLRGACHPAARCADRVARNDPEGACHVLCVIARKCGRSSTPRLLGASVDVCRILDRPVPATPTAFVRRRTSAVKRLRRGFAVLARRSFSEGGKPGDDGCLMSSWSSTILIPVTADSGGHGSRPPGRRTLVSLREFRITARRRMRFLRLPQAYRMAKVAVE